jgi:hypothetical protein
MKPLLKTYLLLIVIFSLPNCSFSQNIVRDVPLAKKFLLSLKKQHIDTIFIYSDRCVGCVVTYAEPNDTTLAKPYECYCPYGDVILYFIWKIKGQSFIKKMDYCSYFNTIPLKTTPTELFNYYKNHIATWRKEKIFWDRYKASSVKEKFKILPPGPDHFNFDEIYFRGYEFSLHDYYFQDKEWDFLTWKDVQNKWIEMTDNYLKANNFKW